MALPQSPPHAGGNGHVCALVWCAGGQGKQASGSWPRSPRSQFGGWGLGADQTAPAEGRSYFQRPDKSSHSCAVIITVSGHDTDTGGFRNHLGVSSESEAGLLARGRLCLVEPQALGPRGRSQVSLCRRGSRPDPLSGLGLGANGLGDGWREGQVPSQADLMAGQAGWPRILREALGTGAPCRDIPQRCSVSPASDGFQSKRIDRSLDSGYRASL